MHARSADDDDFAATVRDARVIRSRTTERAEITCRHIGTADETAWEDRERLHRRIRNRIAKRSGVLEDAHFGMSTRWHGDDIEISIAIHIAHRDLDAPDVAWRESHGAELVEFRSVLFEDADLGCATAARRHDNLVETVSVHVARR